MSLCINPHLCNTLYVYIACFYVASLVFFVFCFLHLYEVFFPCAVVWSAGQRSEVAVESGLEEDKGLEMLALYVSMKPQRLPEPARSIVKECKGECRLMNMPCGSRTCPQAHEHALSGDVTRRH